MLISAVSKISFHYQQRRIIVNNASGLIDGAKLLMNKVQAEFRGCWTT